jgi:hypothetical protein
MVGELCRSKSNKRKERRQDQGPTISFKGMPSMTWKPAAGFHHFPQVPLRRAHLQHMGLWGTFKMQTQAGGVEKISVQGCVWCRVSQPQPPRRITGGCATVTSVSSNLPLFALYTVPITEHKQDSFFSYHQLRQIQVLGGKCYLGIFLTA